MLKGHGVAAQFWNHLEVDESCVVWNLRPLNTEPQTHVRCVSCYAAFTTSSLPPWKRKALGHSLRLALKLHMLELQ